MKERPILFNAEMVRAVLDERKTQTRRIMKPQPDACHDDRRGHRWPSRAHRGMLHLEIEMQDYDGPWSGLCADACPYGQLGDKLWVRETWRTYLSLDGCKPSNIAVGAGIQYEALGTNLPGDLGNYLLGMGKIRQSIFMPRWASSILLEITNVRVARVRDISEDNAKAEGAAPSIVGDDLDGLKYRAGFQTLWDSINANRGYSWEANPWVWVIEFRRIVE